MMKEVRNIGLLTRKRIVTDLKEELGNSQGYFFIGFNKVPAFSLNVLRNNLRNSGAHIFVTKNSLFTLAFEDLKYPDANAFLGAETGVVLLPSGNIVKTCKILVDFSKETETFVLKGGIINDKMISPKGLDELAKLPNKEVLLGMAVSAIASPLTGFLSALNQIILKFMWTIDEIKKKKEDGTKS